MSANDTSLNMVRPVKGIFYITQDFWGRTRWYLKHRAIDIRTRNKKYPNGIGRPILAIFTGQVIKYGYGPLRGNYMYLRHKSGIEARYFHMDRLDHNPGWTIRRRGNVIGYSGDKGQVDGAHLHLEIWKKGQRVDPEPYFYNHIEV